METILAYHDYDVLTIHNGLTHEQLASIDIPSNRPWRYTFMSPEKWQGGFVYGVLWEDGVFQFQFENEYLNPGDTYSIYLSEPRRD
jgi:hypothetical protein